MGMDRHIYERDRHSGAGNCRCGRAKESRIHPHIPTRAVDMKTGEDRPYCVCGVGMDVHPPNNPGGLPTFDQEINRIMGRA